MVKPFIYKITRVFIIGLISMAVSAANQDTRTPSLAWQSWSPAVFDAAQRENRLVLLDLTAEWCQFCRKMDEITYKDPRVLGAIDRNYLAVRADEAQYPELARRYEKYGRPTTVIFDAQGSEIIKRRGYLGAQLMVWFLEAVAQDPSPEAHR